MPIETAICRECEYAFVPVPWMKEFCSLKCNAVYAKANPQWGRRLLNMATECICGAPLQLSPYRKRYCGETCKRVAQRAKRRQAHYEGKY